MNPEPKLARQDDKDGNGSQVSRKSSLNDGKACIGLGRVFASENCSSSSLEDESDKVGNHKRDGVCTGAKAGETFAIDGDDSS